MQHSLVEKKLRQIILTDLIHERFGSLYKAHMELMLNWLKLLMSEMCLSAPEQKVLLSAAYGYHWGCGTLFNLDHSHIDSPFQHLPKCFQLAASKIERFLNYHFSKLFTQEELLKVAQLLEDQTHLDKRNDELSYLLWESSVIAWFELYQDQDSLLNKKNEKEVIGKLDISHLRAQEKNFHNQVSRQVFSSLME